MAFVLALSMFVWISSPVSPARKIANEVETESFEPMEAELEADMLKANSSFEQVSDTVSGDYCVEFRTETAGELFVDLYRGEKVYYKYGRRISRRNKIWSYWTQKREDTLERCYDSPPDLVRVRGSWIGGIWLKTSGSSTERVWTCNSPSCEKEGGWTKRGDAHKVCLGQSPGLAGFTAVCPEKMNC